ncbi:MAG: tetratricopeptide repeat protein [Planctomycetaceae bacterium]|nr:tetratricopeptide repeat protein [Planctomycetaceae bacterium]MCA9045310.1 tetratricopeptide repeat protein [Planctomycetaceae bacterium]
MKNSWQDEQQALDALLAQPDPILHKSLQDAERQRQNKRRWLFSGIAALALVITVGALSLISSKSARANDAATLSAEGWNLWQERKLAEAEAKFAAAIEADSQLESAWNGLGWARLNQGKVEEAIEAFDSCLRISPEYPAALNGKGQALLGQRKYAEAEPILLAAAPQANAAWFGLARLYLLTGEFEKAEVWIKKLSALDPDKQLHQQLLDAAQAESLSDELRQLIEPPLQEDNELAAQLRDAWQLHNTGQFLKGKEQFLKLKEQHPDNAAVLNGLGFCLLNSGDVTGAQPEFEACLKLDPNAAGAMNGLARCLQATGKTEEAIAWWTKLDGLTPYVNAGTVGLAMAHLEAGNYKQALPYFERLVDEIPNNEMFKTHLKTCREKVGS